MKFPFVAAIFLLSLPLVNCGAKSHAGNAKDPIKRMFVHGNPMQFVAGTKGNLDSFLAADKLDDFSGYILATGEILAQKSEIKDDTPQTTATLEDANAAGSLDKRKDKQIPYKFIADGSTFRYVPESGKDELKLEFANENGKLVLKRMGGAVVTPISYSLKTDREAFSLLASVVDGDAGLTLVALYFSKQHKDVAPIADVSPDFHFLLGPGVMTKWNEDITVSLCGAMTPDEEATFRSSIGSWLQMGHLGQRAVKIVRADPSLPFTDMNANCVNMIDDFLFEDVDDAAIMGYTSSVIDHNRQQVVASHIFISRKAFDKIYKGYTFLIPSSMDRTVMHEFGHFLGMDHEFAKKADGSYKYPSIMSYDPSEVGIKSHDWDMVKLQYGPDYSAPTSN